MTVPFYHFYVRGGQVIMPTVVRTEAGFYMDVEPVAIIASAEAAAVTDKLLSILTGECQVVPTPDVQTEPGSCVLEALSLKRWDTFEKEAFLYNFESGGPAMSFYGAGRDGSGRWTAEKTSLLSFPAGYDPVLAVREIYAVIVSDELKAKGPRLLLGPPRQAEKGRGDQDNLIT